MINVVNADGTKEEITKEEFIKRLAMAKELDNAQKKADQEKQDKKEAKQRENAAIKRVLDKEQKGSKKVAGKLDASKNMKEALVKKIKEAMGEIPTVMVGTSEIGLKVDGMFFSIKITQKKTEIEGL